MRMSKVGDIEMLVEVDEMPIIEPGAPNGPLGQGEAELSDQVERASEGGGKARDVAGVLRDLRLDEHDAGRAGKRLRAQTRPHVFGHAGVYPQCLTR